jgi:hypothetical protein
MFDSDDTAADLRRNIFFKSFSYVNWQYSRETEVPLTPFTATTAFTLRETLHGMDRGEFGFYYTPPMGIDAEPRIIEELSLLEAELTKKGVIAECSVWKIW